MDFRKKIFIAILIITIIAGVFIRSPLSLIPLIYIVLSIVVSFLYLLIIKNSCEVLVDTSSNVSFKRMSYEKYNIAIKNKSLLIFPLVKFKMRLKDEQGNIFNKYDYDFILNSKDEKKMEINITFPHIGRYTVEILRIEIFDIFNIFSMNYNPNWKEEVFVEPKTYNILNYDIDTRRAIFPVEFPTAYKIDGEIYDDIREYVPGDSIKNIHWKLSAHANEYMTRILKIDAVSGISVYLDFCAKESLSVFEIAHINDSIIEIAYAIGIYAIKNDRGVNYIYGENNSPVLVTPKDILELKEKVCNLPKLSIEERYKMEIILLEHINSINSLDNVFIVTNNISLDLVSTALEIRDKGKKVILCLVDCSTVNEADRQILKDSSLEYFIVDSAKEFVDSLGGEEIE